MSANEAVTDKFYQSLVPAGGDDVTDRNDDDDDVKKDRHPQTQSGQAYDDDDDHDDPTLINKRKGLSRTNKALEIFADAELFYSPSKTGYISLEVKGHIETHPINSSAFEKLAKYRFYEQTGSALGASAVKELIDLLSAKAAVDGECKEVFLRVGTDGDDLIIDLCDAEWRIVRVTRDGWTVEPAGKLKFWRPAKSTALPVPEKGGSLEALREKLNLPDETSWILFRAYLVYVLRKHREYPILVVQGGQGTSKTTICEVTKRLTDPQSPLQRAAPTRENDFCINALNSHLLCYDNLSGISNEMSDAFCRAATGSGFGGRTLYRQDEESAYEFARPMVLNGIDDIARRQDLQDRAICLHLSKLPRIMRKSKSEFWNEFDRDAGKIFGALLDLLSASYAAEKDIELPELPRMADFAIIGAACQVACGETAESFMGAFDANRQIALEDSVYSDPLASAIVRKMAIVPGGIWEASPTDVLKDLSSLTEGEDKKGWPTVKTIKNRVTRIAPALEAVGIEINEGRTSHKRYIRFERSERKNTSAKTSSLSS